MCFLGIFGDKKGRNTNIFLKVREGKRAEMWSLACLLACPLVAGGWSLCGFRTCQTFGSCPLVACSLLLSALSLCLWCAACKYGSISRFKGVFSGFWAFRVGLCCLRALRGLCGFCARVELGGLKACCVFAFLFVSLPLFLSFLPLFYLFAYLQGFAFVVLVLSAFVALSLCLLFPLRMYRQKERAQFLASSLVLL